MRDLVLAIDVGTTVAKAVVFDMSGKPLAISRRATPLASPRTGWREMDMWRLWATVCEIGREVCANYGDRVAVAGLTAISCGAWLVDRERRPTRAGILYNDARAAETSELWRKEGRLSAIFARCGSVVYPGFTLPLLHWLDQHEPGVLEATSKVLGCKDWLRLCMTGEMGTDETDGSYMPFDVAARNHATDILALCEVERWAALLPAVSRADEIVGELTVEAAAAMGLPAGIPVACGLADLAAATVGGGAIHPGQALTTLGTSCLNNIILAEPNFEPADVGVTGCAMLGRWMRTFVNSSGTSSVDWAIRTFLAGEADPILTLDAEAALSSTGAGGVIFHPYLSGTGVVSPFVHPHAQGQFFGIREHHGRGDLLRSVLEGVALAMRDCYRAAPQMPSEIRLVSGGARSSLWSQIIADCIGVPIVIPDVDEASAWGAAMVGAVAVGMAPNLAELADRVQVRATYQPRSSHQNVYDEIFALYQELGRAASDKWSQHAKILGMLNP